MNMNQKPKMDLSSKLNFFEDLALRGRLIIRLMKDSRVSVFLKLLPIGSLIYLINPIDIPGPLDDIGVVGLGFYLFIEFCPPAIVEEHMNDLRNTVFGKIKDVPSDQVIDGDFKEIKEDKEVKEEDSK